MSKKEIAAYIICTVVGCVFMALASYICVKVYNIGNSDITVGLMVGLSMGLFGMAGLNLVISVITELVKKIGFVKKLMAKYGAGKNATGKEIHN